MLIDDNIIYAGTWALTTPLTREERQAIQAEYDAAKTNYFASHNFYNIY